VIMELLIGLRETMARAAPAAECAGPAEPDAAGPNDAFAELVARALDELPEPFLSALDQVPVLVASDGAAHTAYGLYHAATSPHGDEPARIVIFSDTLTRDFGHDPELLIAQVRRTVRHELAHHLGFDEPGVARLGL
jgi:predicted Zn-dependent protease with MMP-like domain